MLSVYNFRFMGSSALILGLAWFGVGVTMIYGVFKVGEPLATKLWNSSQNILQENTKCLYPLPILYMAELFVLFSRDVVMVWRSEPSYKIAFLDPIATLVILCKFNSNFVVLKCWSQHNLPDVTLHILMSVVALARLFQHEPLDQSVMDFRRLKADQELEETDELQENSFPNVS